MRWSSLCGMLLGCRAYVPRVTPTTLRIRGGASPPESSAAVDKDSTMLLLHPLEDFLRVASPSAALMATAFLSKRKAATSDAARKIIDEFLLEELRRLAALAVAPADGTPASAFLVEWKAFAQGPAWQAYTMQSSHSDVELAWQQLRAFGAEHDRVLPLLANDKELDHGSWPDLAAAMEDAGVVRLDGILSRATAVKLREFILAERDRADANASTGTQMDSLSRVLSPSNVGSGSSSGISHSGSERDEAAAQTTRWDVRVPWNALVESAVREMLGGPLGDALHALNGGDEAPLFECAAIISAEGAAPQVLHSDTILTDGRQLFTAFVAVQDIAPHMGPTRFLPATHQGRSSASSHKRVARGDMGLCEEAVSVSALDMRAGDCTLYDSRLLHCGGAHRAAPLSSLSSERVLFYVSFQHVAAGKRSYMRLIDDADNSILPAVAALGMRLGELRSTF